MVCRTIKFSLMLLGWMFLAFPVTFAQKGPPPLRMNHVTEDCRHNGHLSAAQRRRIYPFNMAASVEVISFKGVYEYDYGEITSPVLPSDTIQHQQAIKHQPPKPDTTERVVLTPAQIDELTDILYNYNYSKRLMIGTTVVLGCWEPRQSILWRDGDGKIFGSVEVCFKCAATYATIPEGTYGIFCADKYAMLKCYFMRLGITCFED
jgi:hypothetical protein